MSGGRRVKKVRNNDRVTPNDVVSTIFHTHKHAAYKLHESNSSSSPFVYSLVYQAERDIPTEHIERGKRFLGWATGLGVMTPPDDNIFVQRIQQDGEDPRVVRVDFLKDCPAIIQREVDTSTSTSANEDYEERMEALRKEIAKLPDSYHPCCQAVQDVMETLKCNLTGLAVSEGGAFGTADIHVRSRLCGLNLKGGTVHYFVHLLH